MSIYIGSHYRVNQSTSESYNVFSAPVIHQFYDQNNVCLENDGTGQQRLCLDYTARDLHPVTARCVHHLPEAGL